MIDTKPATAGQYQSTATVPPGCLPRAAILPRLSVFHRVGKVYSLISHNRPGFFIEVVTL